MKLIGLDMGSTSLSCVLVDTEAGQVLRALTCPVKGALSSDVPGGICFDPDILVVEAVTLLRETAAGQPIAAIGLTGQMHGILYTDAEGKAVSPLYTWQDQRGLLFADAAETYVQRLSRLTGYPMAIGYGLTTHYVLTCRNVVSAQAISLCTIADYLAMRLCALTVPCLHESMAHSLGLWQAAEHRFDVDAMALAGMDPDLLPMTVTDVCIQGYTDEGVPVTVAIGDNQAGFLGTVADPAHSVLLNIGTSGQISFQAEQLPAGCGMELRPCTGGTQLAVGATLCGGRAYQQVAEFLEDCALLCGVAAPDDLYDRMNRAAMGWQGDALTVRPTFSGTRNDPAIRGAITGISRENLSCGALLRGTVEGIIRELHSLYTSLGRARPPMERLIGSGNALRRNPALRQAAERAFGLPLEIPLHREEAAFGAALIGGVGSGTLCSLSQARQLIRCARLDDGPIIS